ncbi:uncharacterized protein [Nicotiana tomentosiformis]|uniref:uncharacterized protein n=1 Tax=Nicotiana tomentosiformis TaxID=4098 RepID=UPI00388C4720
MREKGSNKGKILGEGFTEVMKQAFLEEYEDSVSDKEKEKEDEAISLYTVIDEHQAVETEPPATDFDLWVIFSHEPILPTKMDCEGNKCNKREEEYDDEDHQLVQKNTKSKDLLYRSLCRNILFKVSSFISAHVIWRTLKPDFGDENIKVELMIIEESQTEEEVIGMMAMSDSETEDEANQRDMIKDLKNQVLELTSKNQKSPDIHGKGKMSDMQDKLEKELKRANPQYFSNKSGIGYRKPVPKFDPKYVGISDNKMCTHCGKVEHFGDTCRALIHAQFRSIFGIAKNVKKEEEPKAKPLVHTKWIKVNKKIASNPLPFWERRDLIHPFSDKKGPKLVWVPKTNL